MLNPKMILKIITTFELQDFFEDEGVSTTMIPEETNPEENVQVLCLFMFAEWISFSNLLAFFATQKTLLNLERQQVHNYFERKPC